MRQDAFDDELTRTDSALERDVTPRLVHLDDMSELQVADGDPDIRGWDVRTASGEKIGRVKDLVVDTGLMKVRYFEATIDKEALNASEDRHVLIPIGSARLDDDEDDVYLNASVADPRTLPVYERQSLSREYEQTLRDRFPSGTTGTVGGTRGIESATAFADTPTRNADGRASEADFYSGDLYDDQRFFGQRRRGREDANYIGPIDDEERRRRSEQR